MELETDVGYNPEIMPIDKTKLEELTGVQDIDYPAMLESARTEAKLSKQDIAKKLGISVRAYEMLTDTKKDKRPKPSVDTFVNLIMLRAETRGVNLKALFL